MKESITKFRGLVEYCKIVAVLTFLCGCAVAPGSTRL